MWKSLLINMLTNVEGIRNNSIRTLQNSNHLILSTNIITTIIIIICIHYAL